MSEEELRQYCKDASNEIIKLGEENTQLKKELEYLRSGEYLNQLKFERNMLENIVQNGEVSKEDKEFIDMTHRNTELLEENTQLKSVLKEIREKINFYKTTEWGLRGYSILETFEEIIDKGIGDK